MKPNIYRCRECGGETVTRHVVDGTTPFMLICRATPDCDGQAFSAFYDVPPGTEERATHEWYRPTGAEYEDMKPAMRDHVDMGGLDLREITEEGA